ncbi:carbohydrate-binding protein [Rhizobium sp.]|jgi:hypothetical protein|uniref:carbohydrate-binding protein n=1 Tax=Rhizobium sp. TaxID=391 RepID=UPI002AA63D32
MTLTLKIIDSLGTVLSEASGEDEVILVYRSAYNEGDCVMLQTDQPQHSIILCLDNAMPAALVYLKEKTCRFPIPLQAQKEAYAPQAFSGSMHRLSACVARPEDVFARRNLAFNPYDTQDNAQIFPHASANVSTRGEAAFAARNAIDGEKANTGHGFWPYTSWGINRDQTAALTVQFGRPVVLDEVVLYLRADFPHDAWWERVSLLFDDGETLTVSLAKTHAGQRFAFSPKCVEQVTLHSLIKADDPSLYPAMSQIEFWGRERDGRVFDGDGHRRNTTASERKWEPISRKFSYGIQPRRLC